VSQPSSAETPPQSRRWRLLRPVRLSTDLLATVVIGLLIALYAQRLREARLQDAIALYRNYRTEGIIDALEQPVALGYGDGTPLDQVLRQLKIVTIKNPAMPKLPTGLAIYVDPIGLQEAEVSLNSPVKRPPAADTLSLREHLRRVLEPMGLTYMVKDGFLMITSKDADDAPIAENRDAYLLYRDVLR
jgi:hypothetical protein